MALTSKERILRTILFQEVDRLPLCLFNFSGLRARCSSEMEFIERQLQLGVDTVASLPDLPETFDDRVRIDLWKEPSSPYPLLHKVYKTPKGDIEGIVQQTPDWPHGDDIPLFTDFLIPRTRKFLVTTREDLEPLEFLLKGPTPQQRAKFLQQSKEVKKCADAYQLAVKAGVTRLGGLISSLCGLDQFATLGISNPEIFSGVVEVVSRWQLRKLEVFAEASPDLYLHGECFATPLLSPLLFDRFLSPAIKKEIDWVHNCGGRFCYIGTANVMPFLDLLVGLDIDMLYGIDPIQGDWDFAEVKRKCAGRFCLCGGVNGYLTIVDGTQRDVEDAVESAVAQLAPGGGFILSPVDDIRIDDPALDVDAKWKRIMENVNHLVEVWRESCQRRLV